LSRVKRLETFGEYFKLKWKLCHRPIIEAIGANERLAEWVVRILRCFSREEFLHMGKAILAEVWAARARLDPTPHSYTCLLQLLGLRPSDKSPVCDINH
jgi:hypothetical protein